MNTTLIIMAAGIGSRYGKGIKQLAKIGPHDEIIMDYSIYDAIFKCNFSVCFRAWDYYKFSDRFYRIFN